MTFEQRHPDGICLDSGIPATFAGAPAPKARPSVALARTARPAPKTRPAPVQRAPVALLSASAIYAKRRREIEDAERGAAA